MIHRPGLSQVWRVLLVTVVNAAALMLFSDILAGFDVKDFGWALVTAVADRADQRAGVAAAHPGGAAVHGAHARARRAGAQRPRSPAGGRDRAGRRDHQVRGRHDRGLRADGGQHGGHLAARHRRRGLLVPQRRAPARRRASAPRATSTCPGSTSSRSTASPTTSSSAPSATATRRTWPAGCARAATGCWLGDRLVLADGRLPGRPAARQQRRHAGLPLVGEGPRRGDRDQPPARRRGDRAAPLATAAGCCTRTGRAGRTSSPATPPTPCSR